MAAPEVNVWVGGCWYGPSYPDAGSPPARPLADDPGPQRDAGPVPPPKAGPGSSKAKWETYAEQQGVQVPDGADRDAIIAACDAAGVPTDRDPED
jgi:hypothetical protein